MENRERMVCAVAVAVLSAAMLLPTAAQAAPNGVYDDNCIICRTKARMREAASWLELGADLRLRFYDMQNCKLDKNDATQDTIFHRHRARVWARFTLHEDVDVNVRLMGEPRFWCKPDAKDARTHCEAMLDQWNVQWRKVAGLPLTITAGRQDVKFGEGWLLRDGTPLDGGRSTFFDAIRASLTLKDVQTKLDVIAICNHANSSWLHRPGNDADIELAEHDEKGVVVYASNTSIPKHTLDAYYIFKHTDKVHPTKGWDSDLNTFGVRAKGQIGQPWFYRAELASQFGQKNGTDVCALGANAELAYQFKDAWKSRLRLQYEYRSGDKDRNGAFDILWGRWYQGSNLWHFYVAQLESVLAAPTNYHRVALGWTCKPMKNMSVLLDYHLLFRDENPMAGTAGFTEDGCFRGQLITALIKYKFNEHVQNHLMLDFFFPGNYYSDARNDAAFFLKYQITFTW